MPERVIWDIEQAGAYKNRCEDAVKKKIIHLKLNTEYFRSLKASVNLGAS